MIQVKRIKCGNGNCYIIKENGNGILIDTGKKKYKDIILEHCRGENIKLIVLTHGHVDHAQNAGYLSEKLNVPVAINKLDEELLRDNMIQMLKAKTLQGKFILGLSKGTFNEDVAQFEHSVNIEDGYNLSQYGVDAKIISLPGHTEGSIGIDLGQAGIIVGDALMNMFYPSISPLYYNYDKVVESAEKISELGNRKIYFGHGDSVLNRNWVK